MRLSDRKQPHQARDAYGDTHINQSQRAQVSLDLQAYEEVAGGKRRRDADNQRQQPNGKVSTEYIKFIRVPATAKCQARKKRYERQQLALAFRTLVAVRSGIVLIQGFVSILSGDSAPVLSRSPVSYANCVALFKALLWAST